ncbi:unnamed protein product [Clonostachys byssicola]|uniref:PHD-type domain-containing protein n=1 Tax=Clonostachys byssicola TaxID=160290 RepID=A0A9N9Y8J2_9HYPO|nr:unnamed protein product [Clonostachys byssicola]
MSEINQENATPTGEKRAADPLSVTPSTAKKRKLNSSANESPSAQGAFNAITSKISNYFGFGRTDQAASNGAASPSASSGTNEAPKPAVRPAIKLKALRGTIWDNEEKPRLLASPSKGSPAKQRGRGTPKGTPKGTPGRKRQPRLDDTPTKPRSTVKKIATTRDAIDNELSEDELTSDNVGTPIKQTPGKRLFGSTAGSPAPKSILTPSKNRNQTPKSVKFDNRIDGEVFFDDLPKTSPTKKTASPRKPKAQPVVTNEIVCGMCYKPHSKAPNQIVLCENCDYAVHQECYGILEIPEGDWLCKACSQEDALVPRPEAAVVPTTIATAPVEAVDVPAIPNFDHHLRSYQRVLIDRCTGQRRIEIFGLQDVHEKAHQLIEQTVVAGEGNSMLLIGARGSGKTTQLLENIIADLSKDHGRDFHVVRLNGFIHTDDKLALREIWRQLGKEMQVEDDIANRTNYADTMASLLALLSHPSEIMGTDEGLTSQSIVFILDEFDMFASHPRQTLLYNLFDIAQSRKAPIAVLGCTTRLDIVELLEKRVKSRFSHRYIYLTLPKSLPAFWQVCRQGLIVERKDAQKEGIDINMEGYSEFHKYWSQKIDELYKQKSFQELLQYHYYTTKSAAAFFNDWVLPLSLLSSTNLVIDTPAVAADFTSLAPPDSRMPLLSALSDLELSLVIAAARLDIVAHTDTVNFAMAYDEYSSLVGRQRVQSAASGMLAVGGGVGVWSRGIAGIAWERLITLGLLVPSAVGGGKAMSHGGLEGRMWKLDVALEEIPWAVKLSTVQAKWCKEL